MENRCLLRPLVTLLFEKFSAGATLCTYMWRTLLPRVTSLKTRMTQLIPKNRFSTTSFIMAFWVFIVILFRYLNIRNNLFFLFENMGARTSLDFLEFIEFEIVKVKHVFGNFRLQSIVSLSFFFEKNKNLRFKLGTWIINEKVVIFETDIPKSVWHNSINKQETFPIINHIRFAYTEWKLYRVFCQ